eukprot:5959071-Prymnesium_polylepis.1
MHLPRVVRDAEAHRDARLLALRLRDHLQQRRAAVRLAQRRDEACAAVARGGRANSVKGRARGRANGVKGRARGRAASAAWGWRRGVDGVGLMAWG